MIKVDLEDEDVDVITEALECLLGQYNSSFFTQDMETTIRVDNTIKCIKKNLEFFKNFKK